MAKDITDIIDKFKEHDHTVEDVRAVLSCIGKPGEDRQLKREAVNKLFTRTNNQGFTTADTLESYEEF